MKINAETRAARNADPMPLEPPTAPPGVVELHIEDVVLWGFSPVDRFGIGDALERELKDLVSKHGLSGTTKPASIDRLDAGSFKVAAGAKARSIGGQVAQAVYGKLRPPEAKPKARGNGS